MSGFLEQSNDSINQNQEADDDFEQNQVVLKLSRSNHNSKLQQYRADNFEFNGDSHLENTIKKQVFQ